MKNMMIAGVALLALLSFAGVSSATLLNNPLSYPPLVFDNQGTTTYNANQDLFVCDATPLAITLAPGDTPTIITPSSGVAEFSIMARIDNSGNLVDGVLGDDLLVFGEVDLGGLGIFSGELLTGEVTQFGFEDSGGTTDFYEFQFTLTGGLLAGLYAGGGLGVSITSERSNFTEDFNVDFDGQCKGTLGALPPPPDPEVYPVPSLDRLSVLVFAASIILVGLVLVRRLRWES
jgi:hypothetical protein